MILSGLWSHLSSGVMQHEHVGRRRLVGVRRNPWPFRRKTYVWSYRKQDSAGIFNVSHMNTIPHGYTNGDPPGRAEKS
jgi:hypothetical protein